MRLCSAPDGWTALRLGDVCTKIGSGATPRGGNTAYLDEGPYTLIRSQNVHNDRFRAAGLVYINEQQASDLNNVEVCAGDVLLNITGDSVARSCQVASDMLPARVNQHVAILRPHPSLLSASFLRYALVSPKIQAELLSLAGSGGTRKALTKRQIKSFSIRVPRNVDDQEVIAGILSTIDNKIESNREQSQTLTEVAQTLFKSWFTDFDPTRAKEGGRELALPAHLVDLFSARLVDSELGPIPKSWQVVPFSRIAEQLRDTVDPRHFFWDAVQSL